MRIVRNLIKYTLGLPILLWVTFIGGIVCFVFFVLGEPLDFIIDSIKNAWKPLK